MEKDFFVVMVLGPPGSGKGTQAKLLAEKLGFYHFITSQVGKDYIKTHSDPETLKQKENYDKGLLFDPPWLFNVLKLKTQEIFKQSEKGIVYDGSPRTLYEAENLLGFLDKLIGRENIKVIEISVSEEELRRRLQKRLICDKSSKHVFIRSDKLQPGSPCPEGDGVLRERAMDKSEIFNVRINEYKNRTVPGLEFLKKNHKVLVINGEQSIEDVHKEIMQKIFNDKD